VVVKSFLLLSDQRIQLPEPDLLLAIASHQTSRSLQSSIIYLFELVPCNVLHLDEYVGLILKHLVIRR
jgi:hypothetical protein